MSYDTFVEQENLQKDPKYLGELGATCSGVPRLFYSGFKAQKKDSPHNDLQLATPCIFLRRDGLQRSKNWAVHTAAPGGDIRGILGIVGVGMVRPDRSAVRVAGDHRGYDEVLLRCVSSRKFNSIQSGEPP